MRDWHKPLYLIAAIAAWCAFIWAITPRAHGAGCVPRHCEYTGHERICDCE